MTRTPKSQLLLPLLAMLTLLICSFATPAAVGASTESATVPATSTPAAPASEPTSSSITTPASTTSTSTPTSTVPAPGTATSTTGTSTAGPSSPGTSTNTESAATAPTVKTQAPQALGTPVRRPAKAKGHKTPAGSSAGGGTAAGKSGASSSTHVHAPSPSALTPPPPSALGSSFTSGVSNLFIADFSIPPFLLPIYQAAGSAYGIPWQVLAAINEVETDYGRDLSLSSAGAEGWMQFLPSSWAQYGVDANGDGYADPYNPADAIFAAARYLQAAGGERHIRSAIFAYNHSQSYVESVMLRAQLLRGTPPQLLTAVASLAEARFPVHAPSRFADGFPVVPQHPGRSLVATVIYSRPAAPVIAVQDGVIVAIGNSATLGRYVVLRDDFGDTYTYGHLGSVATFYPVLTPRRRGSSRVRSKRARAAAAAVGDRSRQVPIPAASAGAQPRSPLSTAAVSSGLAFGAAASLEMVPPSRAALTTPTSRRAKHRRPSPAVPRVFIAGREEVHLQPLQIGARVIAGTVIGHLGGAGAEVPILTAPASAGEPGIPGSTLPSASAAGEAPPAGSSAPGGARGTSAAGAPAGTTAPSATAPNAGVVSATAGPQAEMIFQIRPAGVGAPLIDPKPILDSWVRLESSLAYRATGKHRFPAAPSADALTPGAGTSLLEASGNGFAAAPNDAGAAAGGLTAKPPRPGAAVAAGTLDSSLTPGEWLQLVARLGAIPDPDVVGGHSAAAIPDGSGDVAAGGDAANTTESSSGPSGAEQGSGVYN
jgi:membrane-bound lytic murein transglycosylase B